MTPFQSLWLLESGSHLRLPVFLSLPQESESHHLFRLLPLEPASLLCCLLCLWPPRTIWVPTSTLFRLCGCILFATSWSPLHTSARLNRQPSDSRSYNSSPVSTGSSLSLPFISPRPPLTTLNGLAGSFPNISCLCFRLYPNCPSNCIFLLRLQTCSSLSCSHLHSWQPVHLEKINLFHLSL